MANVISNRTKIRRNVSPIEAALTVICTTPASPATQVFDSTAAGGAQYSPDRSLFPTVLRPVVSVSAVDTSWEEPSANGSLANITWKANGKDITLLSDWKGFFDISTDGAWRGELTIRRNVAVSETIEIVMEADYVDSRNSRVLHIVSDPVTLSTTAATEEAYSLHVDEYCLQEYDEAQDPVSIDDYNRAHGFATIADSDRQAAIAAGQSFMRTIPLKLTCGRKTLTSASDITFRIYRVNASGTLTELGDGWDEISQPPAPGKDVVVDMRLVEDGCYMIRAFRTLGGTTWEVARTQFQLRRSDLSYCIDTMARTRMQTGDKVRMDMAQVTSGRRLVERPERLMRMVWKTENDKGAVTVHDEGSVGRIDLVNAGVVDQSGTPLGDMDVWVDAEPRGVHKLLTYKGKPLTYQGKPLIIN